MMPDAFSAIAGHARQMQLLRHWMQEGLLSGTYLFCGPEHVGKETAAMATAMALLCEDAARPGCGACKSCREVASRLHPDVMVLAAEGKSQTIKREQIEALRNRVQLASFHGGWKIGIIKDAHHLHYESAPALLKILEEPPAQTVFFLLSHKEDQVLPTLRSRCKILPFFPLPEEAMTAFLEKSYADSRRHFSLLKNLAAGCPGAVQEVLQGGFLDKRDKILAILEGFTPGRFTDAVAAAEALTAMSKEAAADKGSRAEDRRIFGMLQTLLRDLWLLRLGQADLLMHADRAERLGKLAKRWGNGVPLAALLEQWESGARELESNISPRLLLENLFLGAA